ncbi:hypothetical protein NADFUDRAFT_49565 [Nadsonia fulvescens var. elongata DSM 6958]|uniref:Uncharacterized protein n=1 Tax=Nadsonia fulvescens var. elongata DSM 6958 TaxID=857566 RepID=A0A1E3PNW2_9ASCO|nr:hypothetical protein NADFUDRAFT_49565 [Nadsonia fulvescens var. elongata DSM 6958]
MINQLHLLNFLVSIQPARFYLFLVIPITIVVNWRSFGIASSYRALQKAYQQVFVEKNLEPISKLQKILLSLVFGLGLIQLLYPYMVSEVNIFIETGSLLSTPPDILRSRWLEYKGFKAGEDLSGYLSEADNRLFDFLRIPGSNILYNDFGQDTVSECLFCQPPLPFSYLTFALPKILAPYLINWFFLAVIASDGISSLLSQWRTTITLSHIFLMARDLSLFLLDRETDYFEAKEVSQINWYWMSSRINRGQLIFLLDFAFLVTFTLSITGVLWSKPLQQRRRNLKYNRLIQGLSGTLNGVKSNNVIFQSICRDDHLRNDYKQYWETKTTNQTNQDFTKETSAGTINRNANGNVRAILSKCLS